MWIPVLCLFVTAAACAAQAPTEPQTRPAPQPRPPRQMEPAPAPPDLTTYEGSMQAATRAYSMGQYAEAEMRLRSAVKFADAPDRQPKDERLPAALKQLAAVLFSTGKYDEADLLLTRLVDLSGWEYGQISAELAEAYNALGTLRRGRGVSKDAIPLFERSYPIHLQLFGEGPEMAQDFMQLGGAHADMQEFPKAEGYFYQALRILAKVHGPLDGRLLPVLDQLAGVLRLQRRYEAAVPQYWRALAIRERVFGPLSPELIPTIDGLSYVLFGLRRFTEAEPLYQRLLRLWQGAAGLDSPFVALTLEKMSEFYLAYGDPDEAACLSRKAQEIRRNAFIDGLIGNARFESFAGQTGAARQGYSESLPLLAPDDERRKKVEAELQRTKD